MQRRHFCRHMLAASAVPLILPAADLPREAPDIVITMPNGNPPLRLTHYKGKVIALEFLLTYCSHCQRASRTMEGVYKQYASKGFQVVGAAINPEGDTAAYVREQNLSFPVGRVSQDTCRWFMQLSAMHRLLLPQAAFINRQFQIVETHGGDNDNFFGDKEEELVRSLVERLLAIKSAPASKAAPASKTSPKKTS